MATELQNFRQKYPDYNDLSDSELANMLAKKYPDAYGDLPGKVDQGGQAPQPAQPSTTEPKTAWGKAGKFLFEAPKPFEEDSKYPIVNKLTQAENWVGENLVKPVNRFGLNAMQAFKAGSAGVGRLIGKDETTDDQAERFATIEELSRLKGENSPKESTVTHAATSVIPYLAAGKAGMGNFVLEGINRAYDLPIQNDVDQETANQIAGLNTAARVATAAIPFAGRSFPEIAGLAGFTTALGAGEQFAEKKLLEEKNPELAKTINPVDAKALLTNYVLGVGFPTMQRLPNQDMITASGALKGYKDITKRVVRKVDPRPTRDPELEALSKEWEVPLFAGEVTNNIGLKATETGLERLPLGLGVRGARENQSNSLLSAAKRLMGKFGGEKVEQGDLQENIQENMLKQLKSGKDAAKTAYDNVQQTIDKLGIKGDIQPENLRAEAKQLLADYPDIFDRLPSGTVKSKLEIIAQDTAPTAEVSPVLDAQGKPLSTVKQPTLSFRDARWLREQLNNYINRAYKSSGAVGSKELRQLSRIKSALDADIQQWGDNSGSQEVISAFKQANKVYQDKVTPFKDFMVKKATGNEFDTDLIVNSFIKQDRPQLASKLMGALDAEGQQLVKYAILKRAFEMGTDTKPGVPFSPAKFARNIENLGKTKNVIFTPQERVMVEGFVKLARAAERAGQFAENPPTGLRANDTGITLGLGAGAVTHPLATGGTAAALKSLSLLLTTSAGKKILTKAATTPENSAGWKDLFEFSRNALKTVTDSPNPLKNDKGATIFFTGGGDINFNHDNLNSAAVTGRDSLALQNMNPNVKPVVKMTLREARGIKPGSGKIVFPVKDTAYVMDTNAVHNIIGGRSVLDSIRAAKNMLRSGDESTLLNYPADRQGPTGAVSKTGEVLTDPSDIVREGSAGNLLYGAEGNPAELMPKLQQVSDAVQSNQVYSGFDRRGNTALREKIDSIFQKPMGELTPDDMKALQEAFYRNDTTGLKNQRAFEKMMSEAEPGSTIVSLDADALKFINDRLGHEAGDAVLQAVADAHKEAGISSAANPHGDEYYSLFSPKHADADIDLAMTKTRAILDNKIIAVTDSNGITRYFKGLGFSYGKGKSLAEAEQSLRADKSNREAAGERPARGAVPPRLSEVRRSEGGGFQEVQNSDFLRPVDQRQAQIDALLTAGKQLNISEEQLRALLGRE